MWLDRPPLCAEAQKAVRNTIDDTLKSYILICVRWYSLINIPSRAHRTQNPSLSFSLFFAPPVPIIELYSYVNVCWCICTPVCVRGKKRGRQWGAEIDRTYVCVIDRYISVTWNLRMSRGFPAFFRQFWLHLRKNFRKNLKESTKQKTKTVNYSF